MGKKYVVCGAGGFIGGHFVNHLLSTGREVRALDVKPIADWHQRFEGAENLQADLSLLEACRSGLDGAAYVYNLAADMGGMGFIEKNKAACMLNVLINTHLLMAAKEAQVERFLFASSACVYAAEKQTVSAIEALKESDAYPADPEDGYGWEKLFSERMCRHYREDFGLETRIVRYHNVYGAHETYRGGREKAPAAICRKVITARLSGSRDIEIWGDGEQTRSFTYIDDCLRGSELVINGPYPDPVNVGSSEMVSINGLVSIVEEIAGIKLKRNYKLDAPLGVRGRNSDNALIESLFGWSPATQLKTGMTALYHWIDAQLKAGA
jgi:GDP-D-mannose 3',5'-epimerase